MSQPDTEEQERTDREDDGLVEKVKRIFGRD